MMRWSTDSNALEKSINRHRTYLLDSNIIDIVLVMSTSAAVVVSLKPNLSFSLAGGIAGEMRFLTTSRSTIRDKMGVTEIGLRSLTPLTGVHFGTDVITAIRHELMSWSTNKVDGQY